MDQENWKEKVTEVLTQTKREHNITQLQNTVWVIIINVKWN